MSHRQHGTRVKYVTDRCRCAPCTEASRVAEAARRRQRAYGIESYVDAEPARQHVRSLGEQGMGWKRVARAACLSPSTVWKLIYGNPSIGRAPNKRIRPATADAILAVELDLADGAVVDATGTRRRYQALVAIGYSQTYIATALGMEVSNLNRAMLHYSQVQNSTAKAMRALYEDLSMTPRESTDHHTRISISRSRRHAAWMLWLPPLAWDDDTIDNPFAQPEAGVATDGPDIDEVALERAAAGDRSVRLSFDERVELVRRWQADGGSLHELENRTGINVNRYRSADASEVAA